MQAQLDSDEDMNSMWVKLKESTCIRKIVAEELHNNPFKSLVAFEDEDSQIQIEQFTTRDGSMYLEIDRRYRQIDQTLELLYENSLDEFCDRFLSFGDIERDIGLDFYKRLIQIVSIGTERNRKQVSINYGSGGKME